MGLAVDEMKRVNGLRGFRPVGSGSRGGIVGGLGLDRRCVDGWPSED